MDLATDLP